MSNTGESPGKAGGLPKCNYCDFTGMSGENFTNYGVLGVPTLFLLDQEGVVLKKTAMVDEVIKMIEKKISDTQTQGSLSHSKMLVVANCFMIPVVFKIVYEKPSSIVDFSAGGPQKHHP
jgi:hypothetical protein